MFNLNLFSKYDCLKRILSNEFLHKKSMIPFLHMNINSIRFKWYILLIFVAEAVGLGVVSRLSVKLSSNCLVEFFVSTF